MRILVAEDDRISRSLLTNLLEKNGHEATAVENGTDAWEAIRKPDAPRLAILDWMMPGMNGDEICRRKRAMESSEPTYIIMLTIRGEKKDIVAGLEAGADDYLTKPFDPSELRARIEVGRRILDLQADLAARIREKELLLYEVHHRIKNNMTTIGSLLELQAGALKDPGASAALRDAARRLLSMEVLYDKLYRSENVMEMSVRDYLPQLIGEIVGHFPDGPSVRIETGIEDITLGAKLLTTLGIIVNEIITNSMKHAFPAGKPGRILIRAVREDDRVILSIEDDGKGMPEVPKSPEPNDRPNIRPDARPGARAVSAGGFGLSLIHMMAEQMKGSVRIGGGTESGGRGTRTVLEFPVLSL